MTGAIALASDVEILAGRHTVVVHRPTGGAVRLRNQEYARGVLARLAWAVPPPMAMTTDERHVHDRLLESLETAQLIVRGESAAAEDARRWRSARDDGPLLRPARVTVLDPLPLGEGTAQVLGIDRWSDLALIARRRPDRHARWVVCCSPTTAGIQLTTPFGGPDSTMCWRCLRDRLLGHDDVTRAMWPLLVTGEAVRLTTASPSRGEPVGLDVVTGTSRGVDGVWDRPAGAAPPVFHPVLPLASCGHAWPVVDRTADVGGAGAEQSLPTESLVALRSPLTGVVGPERLVYTAGLPFVVAMAQYAGERIEDDRAAPEGVEPDPAPPPRIAFGVGGSSEEACARAALEGVERYCVLRQPHDAVRGREALERATHWCPGLRRLVDPATRRPRCCDEAQWVGSRTFGSGKVVFVPAATCYQHHKRPATRGSTGAAIQWTRERATSAGFLEVVERDAVDTWWSSRREALPVDLRAVDDQCVVTVVAHHRRCGRSLFALRLPLVVGGVETVVAVSGLDELGFPVLGMGAGFSLRAAAVKAVRELGQALAFEIGEARKWQATPATALRWLAGQRTGEMVSPDRSGPGPDALHRAVDAASRSGRRTLIHDYDRPEVPLPCVRVLLTPELPARDTGAAVSCPTATTSLPW